MARNARSATAVAAVPASRSIDSFGRISKRVAPSSAKPVSMLETAQRFLARRQQQQQEQEQLLQKKKAAVEAPKAKEAADTVSSTKQQRKRRASDIVDSDDDSSIPSATPRKKTAKRARREGAKAKPAAATPSIADLLTRSCTSRPQAAAAADTHNSSDDDDDAPSASSFDQAGRLLARLNLAATSSSRPSPPRSTSSSPYPASTAPTTPSAASDLDSSATSALPQELLDLVRLQAAFAKTLVLHHAHHGINAPVDVRELCPSMAQAWGKRRVTLDDVRRCLGMAAATAGTQHQLFLADYGRGKICIEIRQQQQKQQKQQKQQHPQAGATGSVGDVLTEAFESNLSARWAAAGTCTVQQFVGALPQAPIEQCASLLQTSALRAKGQRSLEELMRGIALKKEQEKAAQDALQQAVSGGDGGAAMDVEPSAPATTAPAPAPAPAPAAPMNLLDRIRYRQLQRAQLQAAGALAAPPTAAELERRAALQRVEDIADVLSMLCAARVGAARVSLGLATILTKIKDSLRQPIAREEAASCVRLLAAEVAPQWLRIVSMGGRDIVIMLPEGMPSKTAIQSRVQSLSQ